MEKNSQQPNENLSVAKFDPALTYAGASNLQLSESEAKALSAPFDDLEYEITPQGFIYLPQAISLQRLNTVIGVGRWGLLLINTGSQEINAKLTKVFYDGALIIRNCFVSRAAGEASYSKENNNQSYATALEAAKTDCRQRCCKDLGIATDAWNPSFVRRWQKEHAIRVFVNKQGKQEVFWRRKDLEPFPNETGIVPTTLTVKPAATPGVELPWLNHGPDYDNVLKELLEGKTISHFRKSWRMSKNTIDALTLLLTQEWEKRLATCKDMDTLAASWNDNQTEIEEYEWLKVMFHNRRDVLKATQPKSKAKAA